MKYFFIGLLLANLQLHGMENQISQWSTWVNLKDAHDGFITDFLYNSDSTQNNQNTNAPKSNQLDDISAVQKLMQTKTTSPDLVGEVDYEKVIVKQQQEIAEKNALILLLQNENTEKDALLEKYQSEKVAHLANLELLLNKITEITLRLERKKI